MVAAIPEDWVWSVAAEGDQGLSIVSLGITLGGHVRVGIEDHHYYRPGKLATSNAELVDRVVRLARELGRPVATATEARAMLKLDPQTTPARELR